MTQTTALRLALGPGYAAGGPSEKLLSLTTRRGVLPTPPRTRR